MKRGKQPQRPCQFSPDGLRGKKNLSSFATTPTAENCAGEGPGSPSRVRENQMNGHPSDFESVSTMAYYESNLLLLRAHFVTIIL